MASSSSQIRDGCSGSGRHRTRRGPRPGRRARGGALPRLTWSSASFDSAGSWSASTIADSTSTTAAPAHPRRDLPTQWGRPQRHDQQRVRVDDRLGRRPPTNCAQQCGRKAGTGVVSGPSVTECAHHGEWRTAHQPRPRAAATDLNRRRRATCGLSPRSFW
jgi:hypothetical protein